jgi:hypothetical protein
MDARMTVRYEPRPPRDLPRRCVRYSAAMARLAPPLLIVSSLAACGRPETVDSTRAASAPASASTAISRISPLHCEPTLTTWPAVGSSSAGLQPTWAASLDGEGAQYGKAIAEGANGTVYATLSNQLGSFMAGGDRIGAQQGTTYAGYLVALDRNGRATWAHTLPGRGVPTSLDGIASDPAGNLWLLGTWSTSLCEPPCRLLDAELSGRSEGFVIEKLSPGSAKALWTRTVVGLAGVRSLSDREGNLLVSGWFRGELRSAELGLDVHRTQDKRDESVLLKISPAGKLVWLRHAPELPSPVKPQRDLVIDSADRLWTIRPSTATSRSSPLLSRLDAEGHPVFDVTPKVELASGAPDDAGIRGLLLAAHPDGDVSLLGNVHGARAELGGVTLDAAVRDIVFVATLTGEGAVKSVRTLEGCGDVSFEDIAGLSGGRVVISGGGADYGALLAVLPPSGAATVFQQPLDQMQLGNLARTGPETFLVVGSKQTDVRFQYRLFAQRVALAAKP